MSHGADSRLRRCPRRNRCGEPERDFRRIERDLRTWRRDGRYRRHRRFRDRATGRGFHRCRYRPGHCDRIHDGHDDGYLGADLDGRVGRHEFLCHSQSFDPDHAQCAGFGPAPPTTTIQGAYDSCGDNDGDDNCRSEYNPADHDGTDRQPADHAAGGTDRHDDDIHGYDNQEPRRRRNLRCRGSRRIRRLRRSHIRRPHHRSPQRDRRSRDRGVHSLEHRWLSSDPPRAYAGGWACGCQS